MAAIALLIIAGAAACSSPADSIKTSDIVERVPFTAPESHRYELRIDNDPSGETVLTVERDGENLALSQLSTDDKGNSDGSQTNVYPDTLKPIANVHTVIDEDQKRVAAAAYEDVPEDECDAARIVRIMQLTFDPPDEETPSDTRSNPLCVPEHSYDNDTSLFIWRTIRFEKDYEVSYKTVISNRRDTRTITLHVVGTEKIEVPAGEFDAWHVEIISDGVHQKAWFATTDDHRLLAYQNQSFYFRLKD